MTNSRIISTGPTEADTCRTYVLPKLYAAKWTDDQISEQRSVTDGRIYLVGDQVKRKKPKRVDYLLRYRRDFTLAVVEAKWQYKKPGDGLQQAKNYAQMLGLQFAYSTNGEGIIEHDFMTGIESPKDSFPSPDELWNRLQKGQGMEEEKITKAVLEPFHVIQGKTPRYYQEIAINRAVQAVTLGKKRVLLTMATGTGKTFVSFQIIWKLWNVRWNRTGEHRKPKILFLADRNILIDKPKDEEFAPFGDARHKIQGGISKSREIYFAIYQAIAKDKNRPGLFRDYPRDFFDLVIVDECHRGSARDESNWREILEYFEPAFQIGMTATPKKEENVDTYKYFGDPIYTYSLKQGIDDGFLAPYKVHRIQTEVDQVGWRPSPGQLDRFNREIPDELFETKDFESVVSLWARTEAMARHLTDFLKKTDRYGKTIVFCVDQEHAEDMRAALTRLNPDLVQKHPDYVARVVSEEGDIGRGHLDHFRDVEEPTPVIVTTSRLLTTGVDIPTCKNIAIARVVNSMTEFKQIIGRGTRVRDDYKKYFFTILDYTGSATRLFADPDFDGDPVSVVEEKIDSEGNPTNISYEEPKSPSEEQRETTDGYDPGDVIVDSPTIDENQPRKKFYVDGGHVEIVADVVYEMDPDGHRLRVVKYSDFTANTVRSLYSSAADLRSKWSRMEERTHILKGLEERGIALIDLIKATGQFDADPFDLLCFVAFSTPLRTRRERAEALKKNKEDFFKRFSEEARAVLTEILEKYIDHGTTEFEIPDILKIPPISKHGNVMEISKLFGGPDQLRQAVVDMQLYLYAA